MDQLLWNLPWLFLILACLPEAVFHLFAFANRSRSCVYHTRPAWRLWILRWFLLAFCLLFAAGYIASAYELKHAAVACIFASCFVYCVYFITFVLSVYQRAFR